MSGPGGAFVLVCIQILAGTFCFMWMAQLRWRFINRGYFRSTTWVLWPLLAALTPLLPAALQPLNAAVAGAMLLFLAAVYSQRPFFEWVAGGAATAGAVWLTVAAGLEACPPGCSSRAVHAAAGLLLMGAVTHGMTLGHWYLNQARLPLEPLARHTWLMFGATSLSGLAGLVSRPALVHGTVPGGIFAFSAGSYWWAWMLMLAATAALGAMIRATVKQRATQSATGLLYIAIVTALGAQFTLNLLVLSP